MTRRLSMTALLFSLLFGPACGSSSAEPSAAAAQAERAAPSQAQPQPTKASATAAPTDTPSGRPTMNECIARCEAEHGPIVDHGRLAECVRQGLDTDTCAHRAINDETNRCQRVCRGLPPELPPELREGAARGGSAHGAPHPATTADAPDEPSTPAAHGATE